MKLAKRSNTTHSLVVSIVGISLLINMHYQDTHSHTHVHLLSRCVDLLILLIRLSYVDVNEETAQLKLLVVRVLQLHRAEAGLDAGQRVDSLTNEVGITKHVFVLNRKPQHGEVRVYNVKLTSLIPDGIEPILLWNGKQKYLSTEQSGNTT